LYCLSIGTTCRPLYSLYDGIHIGSNKALGPGNVYIPLSGAAIGNGWLDPFRQYAAAEAAYGHGIIGRAQLTALGAKEKECQAQLNLKRYTSAVCFNLLDKVVGQSYGSKSNFKVSQYNIRQVESNQGSRTFPPGHKIIETHLGRRGRATGMSTSTVNDVLAAIHATESRIAGQIYKKCTNPPYGALSHQDGFGVVNEVVHVLEHAKEGKEAIRLLFFNGVTDLICNHIGNEVMLEELPWKHRNDWIMAIRAAWKSKSQVGDKISGYIKEYLNLLVSVNGNKGVQKP
jgi:carboxypeptidase D